MLEVLVQYIVDISDTLQDALINAEISGNILSSPSLTATYLPVQET